jgi:hypothetical protein
MAFAVLFKSFRIGLTMARVWRAYTSTLFA